ncbi:MAG: DivIVA domain-containing protein [Actinomycetia bacterium]|nr:DivIVA domain-containing protein [Actinomycetes bacterium]
MSLSSESIQKKEFHIVFKGYKPEEVDKFLDMLSVEFDGLQKKIKELEEKMDSLKYEGDNESSQMKKVIQEALVSAHRVAEEIKQKARIEAEEMVSKKKMEEEQELKDMKNEKALLETNVSKLKMEYNNFKKQVLIFADDFKQSTLNIDNSRLTDALEKVDLNSNTGDNDISEELQIKEDEITVEKSDDETVSGVEDEDRQKIKDPVSSDIEEKEIVYKHAKEDTRNSDEDIGEDDLNDLASLTDEMLERLNQKKNIDQSDRKKDPDREAGEKDIKDDSEKRNRKKIDIANPDIINDFFKADED